MAISNHETFDPPLPGGVRGELIEGTVTIAGGTASETINLELDYDSKPIVTVTPVGGATAEEVTAHLTDDDPTSDGEIDVRVDAATAESKGYHVQVLDRRES